MICTEFPVTLIVWKFHVDAMTIWALAIIMIISSKSVGAKETHLLQLEPKNGSVRLGDEFRFYSTVGDPWARGKMVFKSKGSTAAFCTVLLGIGIQLRNIDGYTCGREGGTMRYYLQIENVSLSDSGTWYCQLGLSMSNNVILDVKFPPAVQIKPYEPCTSLNFMAGEENLTLNCEVVSGNPIPSSFQWYHNLDLVDQEQRYTITRVTRNSGGLYRCVTPDGEDSVYVTVHYKPTITLKERKYVFNETTYHNINCTADANPPAEITWKKSGIDAIIPAPGSVLILKNLRKTDSGMYICIARNTVTRCDGTKTTKIARMIITVEVQYAPTITVFGHQTNITIKEKELVKLRCEADSKPAPTLTIKKTKGHKLDIKNQHSEVKNLTYEFTAECNSSGTYVCSARNLLGNSPSREVWVNVKCQPRPATSDKLIFAGVRGNDVNMKISVISNPKPVFVLQNRAGHVLDRDQNPDYDGYLATGSTTLRISQNTDFGNYNIVVNNTEGEFVFTATIRAQCSATHSTSAGLIAGVTISLIVLIAVIAVAVFLTRKGFRCVLLRPGSEVVNAERQERSGYDDNESNERTDEREQTSNVYDDLTRREAGKQTYEALKIYQNAAALRANAKKQ